MNLHNLTPEDGAFVRAVSVFTGSAETQRLAIHRLVDLLIQLDTELTAATDRADRAEDQVRDLQSRIEELV